MLRNQVKSSHISIRHISQTTPTKAFMDNWFGSKKNKQKEDIIKKQDDYEIDPTSKVVILDESNSPTIDNTFNPNKDLPNFKIKSWKSANLKRFEIQKKFNDEKINDALITTHKQLNNEESLTVDKFADTSLNDLSYRFKFVKILQQSLGFDIKDYTISKSHNLKHLSDELSLLVNTKYPGNERNPNGIVLEQSDFTSGNIYYNKELTPEQQDKKFAKIVEKARKAEENS